jgi:hypothetical protein
VLKGGWIQLILCAGMLQVAGGREGILLGDGYLFRPFAGAEIGHDNNVYQTDEPLSDLYWKYSVGAQLKQVSDSVQLYSSAWYERRAFQEYTEKNSNRWGVAGMLRVISDKSYVSLSVDSRLVDELRDAPVHGALPEEVEGVAVERMDRSSSLERRHLDDVKIDFRRTLPDETTLAAGYGFYRVDYDREGLSGWQEHAVGAEYALLGSDKTRPFAEVKVAMQSGDGAPLNGATGVARVGVKNRLTDKSAARIGVGLIYYENQTFEYVGTSVAMDVGWLPTEKLQFGLRLHNDVQPVGNGQDVQLGTRLGVGGRYQFASSWVLSASGTMVYDQTLTGEEATRLQSIGTARMDYFIQAGWNLFSTLEYLDVQQDVEADYDRFRALLGTAYIF